MEQQHATVPEQEDRIPVVPEPRKSFWETNRTLFKSLLIGFLILLMLIPASFIRELVQEREARQQQVIREVSAKWAQEQTVKGPVMVIPYWIYETQSNKTVIKVRKNAFIMPQQLNIKGKINPELRHRSIYEVTLYRSSLNIEGSFRSADLVSAGISPEQIIEQDIKLMVGVDDVRGLEQDISMIFNGDTMLMDADLPANDYITRGLSKTVRWDRSKDMNFSFNLQLKGSGELRFIPVGKTTKLSLSSPWLHPSFEGKFIPSEPANIDHQGFNAHWTILQVSSGIPGILMGQRINLDEYSFGVRFLQPTDGYAKTQRSVKYALLFIGLTFTVFFFIEILQQKNIHPLQYLLVGLALCVFYTLLLSFTEYAGFNFSYSMASLATVLLIGFYVWGVFKSRKIALVFTAALAALYGYIFVLIQLEDFALLFGSIGLFVLLATVMYTSRKIDWYGTLKQGNKK